MTASIHTPKPTVKKPQPILFGSHRALVNTRARFLEHIRQKRVAARRWPLAARQFEAVAVELDLHLFLSDRDLQRQDRRLFDRVVAQSNREYVAECRRRVQAPPTAHPVTPSPALLPPALAVAA